MNNDNSIDNYILSAINASIKAGKVILDVYNDKEYSVTYKTDKSPVTIADKLAHNIIIKDLESTAIPILSEEGKSIPYEKRKNWDLFFLVDPLDGTKEFINHKTDFTGNIALIKNKKPVGGVVYVPVIDALYFSSCNIGAYKLVNPLSTIESLLEPGFSSIEFLIDKSEKLNKEIDTDKIEVLNIIAIRSHFSKETEDYINMLKQNGLSVDIVSAGSSLKICLIAEGKAHIYPRFGPTMEWDTAAGQAIVDYAGGIVTETELNKSLLYNKENLLNPFFIVMKNEMKSFLESKGIDR